MGSILGVLYLVLPEFRDPGFLYYVLMLRAYYPKVRLSFLRVLNPRLLYGHCLFGVMSSLALTFNLTKPRVT